MNDELAVSQENLGRRIEAYRAPDSRSRLFYKRGLDVLAGGNSRLSIVLSPYPIYAQSGKGCRITDVEGEERIDFLNNFTSLILGHADPIVTSAVHKQIDQGTAFTMPTSIEIELAELLVGRVEYIEQIRFCNSGTEGVMLAIKAARAFTGKPMIAKIEGAYHGTYDFAAVSDTPEPDNWGPVSEPASTSESGSPVGVTDSVVVLPLNDIEAARTLIKQHANELAAVLIDPMPAAIGMVETTAEYLAVLRKLANESGALLIVDEVMSFRIAFDGALAGAGIEADLVALGKIIGGGYPIGAVAGRRDVMAVFDHNKELKVHHGGTFNANPVTMTAGLATMKQMTRFAYDELALKGDYIRIKIAEMLARNGVKCQINGRGSLFVGVLTDKPVRNYRDFAALAGQPERTPKLCHEMLRRGIVVSTRGILGCLSTPMQEAELDAYVDALEGSLKAIGVISK